MSATMTLAQGGSIQPPVGLPRLLAGPRQPSLADHESHWGKLPKPSYDELVHLLQETRLAGRGGAGFPAWRKLAAAIEGRRPPIVIANAAESEPLSGKDRLLLQRSPHLVLDGLAIVARAIGASRVVVYAKADQAADDAMTRAVHERRQRSLDPAPIEIIVAPQRFLAGQETAIIGRISGGEPVPTYSDHRVTTRGLDGRPTVVHNAETLAQIALIARGGASWFNSVGTTAEPGSMLASIHPASGKPRVAELELGTSLSSVLEPSTEFGPVLLGGFHGVWLAASDREGVKLSNAELAPFNASLGAGIIAELPHNSCGVRETARILHWLASESAGQCGPCLNGLPRISRLLTAIGGCGGSRADLAQIEHWSGLVVGRGACRHPDGSLRMVASALRVFSDEVEEHLAGRCSATSWEGHFTLPAGPKTEADWR